MKITTDINMIWLTVIFLIIGSVLDNCRYTAQKNEISQLKARVINLELLCK